MHYVIREIQYYINQKMFKAKDDIASELHYT